MVLVSPTEIGIKREGPVQDALYLPYYAATAWHHGQLAPELQAMELEDYLPEVEAFTISELLPVLAQGGFVDAATREATAATMSRYTSLSAECFLQHNLVVQPNFFWKELLRHEGFTIGRLDSRYAMPPASQRSSEDSLTEAERQTCAGTPASTGRTPGAALTTTPKCRRGITSSHLR